MHDLIRRTLEWLRLLFAPGTGKRRRSHCHPTPRLHLTPVRPTAPLPHHRSPYGLPTPLDGTASAGACACPHRTATSQNPGM
ncbi:hypothetical protein ACFYYD_36925 [Streptomyces bluensis]|uniref:hypothetical protein n=1 Tax=Streptomyces bluensis TaxID=33897 RepID=UPI0036A31449